MRHSRIVLPLLVLNFVVATAASALAIDEPVTPGSLVAAGADGTPIDLPLRHTSVSIEVSAFVARATVEQVFVNPFDRPIEAIYTFPLGHEVAVDQFEMQSGDRVVRGEVRRRGEARRVYEAARSEGRQAALLEQGRPNMFTQSVANLMPAGQIRVRIRTVEVLRYEAGVYQLTFPLVVGPRYIPGEQMEPGLAAYQAANPGAALLAPVLREPPKLHPGQRSGHDVDITVHLDAGVRVEEPTSPSHVVTVARERASRVRVELSPADRIPNKDFVLRWTVGSDEPDVAVLTHRDGVDGYFAFVVQPQTSIDEEQAAPKEILFVLDTSGSMSGAPLCMSKRFIRDALQSLGSQDTFNLIRFAGDSGVFAESSVDGTEENVDRAIRWVEKLQGRGGTVMHRGLARAVAQEPDGSRVRIIVFLTDGHIGNEVEILARIKQLPEDVRIFTLGIGSSVNHYLLDGMARVGGGAYTFIPNDADADTALDRFTAWVTRPYLTGLEIDWGALPVGDWIPEIPRDLFAAQNLTVIGRYFGEAAGTVTLRGRLGGSYWEKTLPIVLPERDPQHGGLASIWARHRIQALTDESEDPLDDRTREEVIALALEHQIMSAYTSFVAVDYEVVNPGGEVEPFVQPVPLPEGVLAGGVSSGISVEVQDSEGQPLPGATVTISHATGAIRTSASLADRSGRVAFPVLPPGDGYAIHVSFPGFAPVRVENIPVANGSGALVPVRMSSEIVERVRVTAKMQVVDLETTETASRFSEDFVSDLPVSGRFHQNVMTMAPGVTDADRDGIPNVHGARDRDFAAMIGGVRNVDPLTGQFMSRINPNSIEEIEVLTAGAGVEFGRAQGGFARIIQKQGNNEHEGQVDLQLGSSALDGIGGREIPGDYRDLRGGFSLSGPFLRDRLWYRASHEWRDRTDPVVAGDEMFVVPRTVGTHSDVLTWQASPRNKLRFQADWQRDDGSGSGVSTLVRPETTPRIERNERLLSVAWTMPFSPRILVESVVSRRDSAFERSPAEIPVENLCLSPDDPLLGDTECLDLLVGLQTGTTHRRFADETRRYELESRTTIYGGRFWGANHEVRAGLQFGAEIFTREIARDPNLARTLYEDAEAVLARTSAERVTDASADAFNWALFAEDQFTPSQGLTVTVGLRVDFERVDAGGFSPFDPAAELGQFITEADGLTDAERVELAGRTFTGPEDLQGFLDGVADRVGEDRCCADPAIGPEQIHLPRTPVQLRIEDWNLSPFFSVKWSPGSSGRRAFTLAARRYHDRLLPVYALVETEPATADLFVTSEPATVRPSIQRIEPGLRTPYQNEWLLRFEQEILTETSLSVGLVLRDFERQIEQREINHQPGDFKSCGDPIFVLPGADGTLDDCNLDGRPDLYVQNPLWGDIHLVGNYGSGTYRGVTLAVERRMYRNWQLGASYTLSVAEGSAEGWDPLLGDTRTLLENLDGYRAFDQRHVFKIQATWITPFGWRFGGTLTVESGLPYSELEHRVVLDSISPVLEGLTESVPIPRLTYTAATRNVSRNDPFVNLDLRLTKEMNFGRGLNMVWSLDILNALDDRMRLIYPGELEYGRTINDFADSTSRFGRRYAVTLRLNF